MWPQEVMYSSRWDFWFSKSGCVNNNRRQQQSVFPAPHRVSSSSTMGFWGFMSFEKLLSQASVTLDHHPIVICAVDMFLGQILRFFVVGVLLSFPHIGHVMSLYKRQNVLDRILNFFLVIVKHVFRAFGMYFLRIFFFWDISFFGEQIFGNKNHRFEGLYVLYNSQVPDCKNILCCGCYWARRWAFFSIT